MSQVVAIRYAQALAEIVMSAPDRPVESTTNELRIIDDLLHTSPDLKEVLLSPAVPPARKRAVVGKIGDMAGISRTVRNFLFVLINRRRIHLLSQIRQAFEAAIDEQLGVVRAEVKSAAPLTPEQQGFMQSELARITGKQVRVEYAIDADLIGGVMAKIGSTVYDGSIRAQLNTLRARLV